MSKQTSKFNPRSRVHFMLTILKWLDLFYIRNDEETNRVLLHSERLCLKFLRILRTRGKKEAIKFCKELRSSIIEWLTTIYSLDKDVRSSSKYGLPKDLRFLKRISNLRHAHLRLILSSLYFSRGVELKPQVNTESITRRPLKEGIPLYMNKYVPEFWQLLGIRHGNSEIPKAVCWNGYHLSTKQGPNGQSLWSAIRDLFLLPPSLLYDLCVVGGDKLTTRICLLRKYSSLKALFPGLERGYRKT